MVEQHVTELDRALDLGQPIVMRERTLTNDQAIGVMIAAVLFKGGTKPDQAMADALTEDYLDAVEDVPAWAVREAIRKWNRRESQPLERVPHRFEFRPAPPTLRALSMIEVMRLRSRKTDLERLIQAVPLIEYTAEHRTEMLTKLAAVMHNICPTPRPAAEAAE